MIDVVTVPDFTNQSARAFEARTLLFLGSWMEHSGSARAWPVHVACIGEPPASVRWLAERCGAHVSVHAPVKGLGTSANKLRGLEVGARTQSVFLLDTDVVFLSDPGELSGLGSCLSAAPANVPRVPGPYWRRIYAALGLELPEERMACVTAELSCQPRLGMVYPEQGSEMSSMLPYFNGGAILAPWDCGLRDRWEAHMRTIQTCFTERDLVWPRIAGSDMTGLATAIQSLRLEGVPFTRLPASYNATWLHLYRGALAVDSIKAFHAMFLFGKTRPTTRNLATQLSRFRLHLAHRLLTEWRRDNTDAWIAARGFLWPSLVGAHQLGHRLHRLYQLHVKPALARN